jgi:hypothetical protein
MEVSPSASCRTETLRSSCPKCTFLVTGNLIRVAEKKFSCDEDMKEKCENAML